MQQTLGNLPIYKFISVRNIWNSRVERLSPIKCGTEFSFRGHVKSENAEASYKKMRHNSKLYSAFKTMHNFLNLFLKFENKTCCNIYA